MKKQLCILLTAIMILTFSVNAFAQPGDIIGYATYTDIVAYINHHPITSYNINDDTVIIAEDLRNYGFDVVWDNDTRSLRITRSTATSITGSGTVYSYGSMQGQPSVAYLETDIKTYIDGKCVSGYNIGGSTVVKMDDLAPYGEISWVPDTRSLKMWIDDLPITAYRKPADISITGLSTSSSSAKKSIPTSEIPSLLNYTDTKSLQDISSDIVAYLNGKTYAVQKVQTHIVKAKTNFTNAYNIAIKYSNTQNVAKGISEIIAELDTLSDMTLSYSTAEAFLQHTNTCITLMDEVIADLEALMCK